jgi:hypothetical protein
MKSIQSDYLKDKRHNSIGTDSDYQNHTKNSASIAAHMTGLRGAKDSRLEKDLCYALD